MEYKLSIIQDIYYILCMISECHVKINIYYRVRNLLVIYIFDADCDCLARAL